MFFPFIGRQGEKAVHNGTRSLRRPPHGTSASTFSLINGHRTPPRFSSFHGKPPPHPLQSGRI